MVPGATTHANLTWGSDNLIVVGDKVALSTIPLGIVDFFVHHIHAFTIRVMVLIIIKGTLFARGFV